MRNIYVVIGLFGAVGCLDMEDTELDETSQEINPIREPQGRAILGETLDTRPGGTPTQADPSVLFSVSNQLGQARVAVSGACLIDSAQPAAGCQDFAGATMTGSDGTQLRINSAQFRSPTQRAYQVTLAATGAPLCPVTGFAFPIAGEWSRNNGNHSTLRISSRFTWACELDGVVAKAIQWGAEPGTSSTDAKWIEHQTAVRMGRADYCYTGGSRTMKGTEIFMYDNASLQPFPQAASTPTVANQLYFEAAWVKDPSDETGKVLCLSKLRWSTLSFGNKCGGRLKDPRSNPDAKFCEDYGDYSMMAASPNNAILYNQSEINDVGLYRWTNPTTGDQWSTARGFVRNSLSATQADVPAAGYTTHVRREGNILTDDGKAVITANYGGTFVRLNTYAIGNDRITTTPGHVPAGAALVNQEGWIFSTAPTNLPAGFQTVPLYRYKKSAGTDRLASTATAVAGYTRELQLGWVSTGATDAY